MYVSMFVTHAVVKRDLEVGTGRRQKTTGDHGGYAAAGTLDPRKGEGLGAFVGAGCGQTDEGDVQLKLPNAGVGYEFSPGGDIRAIAKAELISASASAGPAKATLGLSADTGGSIGLSGVEAKVLGTGISFGRKMGVSFLGSSFELKLW